MAGRNDNKAGYDGVDDEIEKADQGGSEQLAQGIFSLIACETDSKCDVQAIVTRASLSVRNRPLLTLYSEELPGIPKVEIRGYVPMPKIRTFLKDESAATAIEYGLIAAGISVGIIPVVNALGGQLKTTFTHVKTELGKAGK
jgi:pilus assembly protein Flp/PilA